MHKHTHIHTPKCITLFLLEYTKGKLSNNHMRDRYEQLDRLCVIEEKTPFTNQFKKLKLKWTHCPRIYLLRSRQVLDKEKL